jgi:hypothetical protein
MDTTLTIAVLGATVSALGWVANYIVSTTADKRRQRLISRLEFTKQQLEELYGPLAFLVLEGRRTWQDLLAVLGRDYVFPADNRALPEKELEVWLFWVENDFFPRNYKIQELLSTKTHLIEGEKVPDSYLAFLDHHNSWKILHERWEKQKNEYSWHSKLNWPLEFEKDVISTFEELKKRHSRLLGRVS